MENLLGEDFSISTIAKKLSVSERTIYRRMREYDLSKRNFFEINDNKLDVIVTQKVEDLPALGEVMLKQILYNDNVFVPWMRLRDSMHRVDE